MTYDMSADTEARICAICFLVSLKVKLILLLLVMFMRTYILLPGAMRSLCARVRGRGPAGLPSVHQLGPDRGSVRRAAGFFWS